MVNAASRTEIIWRPFEGPPPRHPQEVASHAGCRLARYGDVALLWVSPVPGTPAECPPTLPLPEFQIQGHRGGGDAIRTAQLWNCGRVPALDVRIIDAQGNEVEFVQVVSPGHSAPFKHKFDTAWFSMSGGYLPALRVHYRTPTGEAICEVFVLLPLASGEISVQHAGRRFMGASLSAATPELVTCSGLWMVPRDPVNVQYYEPLQLKPDRAV